MKKVIVLFVCLAVLSGCSNAAAIVNEKIEKYSKISVQVPSLQYAQNLQKLWNRIYPERKDAIQFIIEPFAFSYAIDEDIIWTSDTNALFLKSKAMALEKEKKRLNDRQLREELKNVFIPIEGKGLLFAWDEKTLKERSGNENSITSFEAMSLLGDKIYYHNHTAAYIYPFLHLSRQKILIMNSLFSEDEWKESLLSYKELYQKMNLTDDMYTFNDFFKEGYASGLLDTQSAYQKQKAYKEHTLHISSMPSWKKEKLHPIVTTYGFLADGNCENPIIANAFMELVNSKEGIQAFLDSDAGIALIRKEEISSYEIYDYVKKEMIVAMQDSELSDESCLKEKPSITFSSILSDSAITEIMQNYICSTKNAEDAVKQIKEDTYRWILRQ